ncbi:MAG: hypothetical protein IJ829_01650, partial [Kiritimatiellae bacterium]|nr:hypothetical protein [Kiritimatiellia bacterium]
MNKTEKIICVLLGAVLAWYVWSEMGRAKERARYAAEMAAASETNQVAEAAADEKSVAPAVERAKPSAPEQIVVLENDDIRLELSSWGGVVKKATLKIYAKDRGEVSDENPPVEMDFSDAPLGMLGDIDGSDGYAIEVRDVSTNSVKFLVGGWERTVTLGAGYLVTYDDVCLRDYTATDRSPQTLSLGLMRMGDSKSDLLSVDSWAMDAGKGREGVLHHCEGDSPLKGYLVGGLSGGCSGSKSAAGMPERAVVPVAGAQKWVALKNRFFVTALASSTAANAGFEATVARDMNAANYRPASVAARVRLLELLIRLAAQRVALFLLRADV